MPQSFAVSLIRMEAQSGCPSVLAGMQNSNTFPFLPPPFRYYTLDLKRQFYEKEMENSIQSRIHSFKNSINNIKGLSCALHRATIIRVCCV